MSTYLADPTFDVTKLFGAAKFWSSSREMYWSVSVLWGDADFVFDLILEPERQYADENCTIRLYHDMHTGKWWWKSQVFNNSS